jgi:pyruvate decarboxylase
MSAEISCATTVIRDGPSAAGEIDRVLNAMLFHSKPVYIGIPEGKLDVVEKTFLGGHRRD